MLDIESETKPLTVKLSQNHCQEGSILTEDIKNYLIEGSCEISLEKNRQEEMIEYCHVLLMNKATWILVKI